jgi:catalase
MGRIHGDPEKKRAGATMSDAARPKPPITTTDSGIPAPSDEFSLTVGPGGPTVLHDHYLVQKVQHFNRERVPERVVHAKGSGAHGFFEVTEDVSQYTKADLFQPGRRTPLFITTTTAGTTATTWASATGRSGTSRT